MEDNEVRPPNRSIISIVLALLIGYGIYTFVKIVLNFKLPLFVWPLFFLWVLFSSTVAILLFREQKNIARTNSRDRVSARVMLALSIYLFAFLAAAVSITGKSNINPINYPHWYQLLGALSLITTALMFLVSTNLRGRAG